MLLLVILSVNQSVREYGKCAVTCPHVTVKPLFFRHARARDDTQINILAQAVKPRTTETNPLH